jgi:hypothetical protein
MERKTIKAEILAGLKAANKKSLSMEEFKKSATSCSNCLLSGPTVIT